jgi:hypothetical protein
MAHWDAIKERSGTGERKEKVEAGVPVPAVTLRKGYWYAGEVRCGSYREALSRTLLAAGFLSEKPQKPARPKPHPRPERLETRLWWDEFLDARAIREAKRIADEQAVREAEAERIWAAVKTGGTLSRGAGTDADLVIARDKQMLGAGA